MDKTSDTCTCGKPSRPERSLVEMLARVHLCEECWQDRLKLLHSGKIEQTAQAQYDKMMRDMKDGMEPMEAWRRRGESDG